MVAVASSVAAAGIAAAGAIGAAGISAGVTSSASGSAKSAARDAQKLQQQGAGGVYHVNRQAQDVIAEKTKQLSQAIFDKSISAGASVVEASRNAQNAIYEGQQMAVRARRDDNTRSQDQIYEQALADIGKIYGVQVGASSESAKYLSDASTGARDALVSSSADALKAKLDSSNLSDQQYRDAYAKIEAGLTPYTDAGLAAIMGQQDLLGLHGEQAQKLAFQGIEGGQYKELARQGEDALLQNAAATGGVRGGNVAGALAQFRPSMLQMLIDKQFNQLSGLRDTGYNAQSRLSGYQSDLGGNLATGAQFRGNVTAQSAEDIGGFNAQNEINQGNILAQDATNRGQYGADAATSRGVAANNRLVNLNNITQAEINARLQYFMDHRGALRDIENENVLRNLGYDIDNLAGQYGADINREAQNATAFSDYINNYTGAGTNAANTIGNINANKSLGVGKAVSSGIGGLAGALSKYYDTPQQVEQPQQYGFAGLRQQPMQLNFNQGQPKNGFWSS